MELKEKQFFSYKHQEYIACEIIPIESAKTKTVLVKTYAKFKTSLVQFFALLGETEKTNIELAAESIVKQI